MCQLCNSSHATIFTPNDGACDAETCRVVEEGHEIEMVKPGTAQKVSLKIVFVYIYQNIIKGSDDIV